MARTKQCARKSGPRRSGDRGHRDREGARDKNPPQGERLNYPEIVKENEMFIKYYKSQGFVPEGEWSQFINSLQETLPVTFRLTGYKNESKELLKIIKNQYLDSLMSSHEEAETREPPKCLEWYPHGLAWQIDLSRKEIRNNERLRQLHNFLIAETETGNISRQEAVSMIPPLLMDIKPHHKVLDMCAAPGSKTGQLIESLHQNDSKDLPEGFVVANDSDNKRCYLMVHQVKRLQTPNCVIVNHDATVMPKMLAGNDDQEFIFYDRILCDVPCSGDGTLRKNPDAWMRWSTIQGCNLHSLQLKILKRGLELLADGGRLIYSTCSFNPVEDEAVVATMLAKCEGTVELIDVEGQLPGLKYSAGRHSWKCMSKDGNIFEKLEDVPDNLKGIHRPTMFPPSEKEASEMHLERCIRILPHLQNTGGFFVAVMEKKSCLPWCKPVESGKTDVSTEDKNLEQSTTANENKDLDEAMPVTANENESTKEIEIDSEPKESTETTKKRNHPTMEVRPNKRPRLAWGYKEDPFLFLDKDDPLWASVKGFYSVDDTFPQEQLMYRCETGAKRTLYFVSSSVRNLVETNKDRVKFINLGLKALVRKASPLVEKCDFRLTLEALSAIHHYFPGRKVQMSKEDIITFLSSDSPFISRFSNSVQDQCRSLDAGSAIFYFIPTESEPEPACEIMLCGWRGMTSLRSFINKPAREHYLRLCGMENSAIAELRANDEDGLIPKLSKRQARKQRRKERKQERREKGDTGTEEVLEEEDEKDEQLEKENEHDGLEQELIDNDVKTDNDVTKVEKELNSEEKVKNIEKEPNSAESVSEKGESEEG
ncbi:hypothetical protein ScPMuIL_001437 [Solemya velum]